MQSRVLPMVLLSLFVVGCRAKHESSNSTPSSISTAGEEHSQEFRYQLRQLKLEYEAAGLLLMTVDEGKLEAEELSQAISTAEDAYARSLRSEASAALIRLLWLERYLLLQAEAKVRKRLGLTPRLITPLAKN